MQAGSRGGARTSVARFTRHESDDENQPAGRLPDEQVDLDVSEEDGGSSDREPLPALQAGPSAPYTQGSVSSLVEQLRHMVTHGSTAGAVAAGAVALAMGAWGLLATVRRRSHSTGSRQACRAPSRSMQAGVGSMHAQLPEGGAAGLEAGANSASAGKGRSQLNQAVQAGPLSRLKPNAGCVALADGSACVVRRKIAADNSCMFNAVGWCMHHSHNRASFLRNVVSQEVSSDPQKYTAAFLGMPNHSYCAWIVQPSNWGGGIELSILASHYRREIAAWNIESAKNHVFGEESGYSKQVMLLYTGTHYDALAIAASPRADPEDDVTEFNPRTKRGKMIIAAAQKLVELNRQRSRPQAMHGAAATAASPTMSSGPHTASLGKQERQTVPSQDDGAGISETAVLQCTECASTMAGHEQAIAHAGETGHQHFAELVPASSA